MTRLGLRSLALSIAATPLPASQQALNGVALSMKSHMARRTAALSSTMRIHMAARIIDRAWAQIYTFPHTITSAVPNLQTDSAIPPTLTSAFVPPMWKPAQDILPLRTISVLARPCATAVRFALLRLLPLGVFVSR